MKIKHPLLMKLGGLLSTAAVRTWMGALDSQAVFEDPRTDPSHPLCTQQRIYLFWHEYILFPFYLRGHCNLAMLLSRHTDAEILSYAAHHMGFDFVRGSTQRGGTRAIRELRRKSEGKHLTITPDGPRGPRRQLAPGAIYLASRLQTPIILLGFGYDRPYRFKRAWDQFAIPRFGSRARAIISGDIHVPPNLDRAGIEQWRETIETQLNQLTNQAETWAESGRRHPNQQPLRKQTAPLPSRRAA